MMCMTPGRATCFKHSPRSVILLSPGRFDTIAFTPTLLLLPSAQKSSSILIRSESKLSGPAIQRGTMAPDLWASSGGTVQCPLPLKIVFAHSAFSMFRAPSISAAAKAISRIVLATEAGTVRVESSSIRANAS